MFLQLLMDSRKLEKVEAREEVDEIDEAKKEILNGRNASFKLDGCLKQ
jgi:hypothetical protein